MTIFFQANKLTNCKRIFLLKYKIKVGRIEKPKKSISYIRERFITEMIKKISKKD